MAPKLPRLLRALPTVIEPVPALIVVPLVIARSPLACVTLPLAALVSTLRLDAVMAPRGSAPWLTTETLPVPALPA